MCLNVRRHSICPVLLPYWLSQAISLSACLTFCPCPYFSSHYRFLIINDVEWSRALYPLHPFGISAASPTFPPSEDPYPRYTSYLVPSGCYDQYTPSDALNGHLVSCQAFSTRSIPLLREWYHQPLRRLSMTKIGQSWSLQSSIC